MNILKIGEVFQFIRNGKSIKQNGNEGYPITRIETIAEGKVNFNRLGYASIFELCDYKDYLLKNNDILMSHINSEKHLGKVAIFEGNENIIHGMNLLCLRTKKEVLYPTYAYYYFCSNYFKKQIPRITKKSVNQASFNVTSLKQLNIIVPSLEIQRKTVEALDKAQSLIDMRKKQIELLDELIQSVFIDMFGDPVSNPKGWDIGSFSDIVDINPKKVEVKNREALAVSFVPMANVSEQGELKLREVKKIYEVYKGFTYFKENDVLFAKITPCMENGKGCIAKNLKNGIGFGSTEFHVFRPKENISSSEFIFYFTKLTQFRKTAESNMTGSAGQKRVPTDFFDRIKCYKPPMELQMKYSEIVNTIKYQKQLLRKSIEELQTNFNSIMQKAFKGELFK
jgi:type I restriction enzyme S subunit